MSQQLVLGMIYVVTGATVIGSAPMRLGVDKETYKDSSGEPLIPGPTIKGVLRTAACYAARSLGLSCCGAKNPETMEEVHEVLENTVVINGRRYCHVCALFGAPGLGSALAVESARPLNGVYSLGVRPGLEIDDYTLTAREARLYYYEVIEPGSLFSGEIVVDLNVLEERGIRCDALRLLLTGLGYVEAVGTGHGLVKPLIRWISVGGRRAENPRDAARLVGCEGLEPRVFENIWAPGTIRLVEV